MRWFKHDADANQDAKLKKLRMKYGLEGYGLYWYCLEQIAVNVVDSKFTFELEHDSEILSYDTGLHIERISEMMAYMVDLGLFENSHGIVTCLQMAKRLDKSMTSNPKMREMIAGIRKNHDPVMTPSADIMQDKIRLDKNRKEITTTSDKPKKYEDSDIDFARKAFEEIQKVNPSHKKPNLESWAEEVSRMVRIDKRTLFEMAELWVWVRQDPFWKTNVLSMSKFREKYDQLKMKAMETAAPQAKSKVAAALRNVADTDW